MTVTGTKRSAKNTDKTATKSIRSTTRTAPSIPPKALERCIPYAEKLRLMLIEVLREESGRELQAEARFKDQEFDWQAHNKQFRNDYINTSMRDLMRAARELYGLNDLDVIRERRKAHRDKRNTRILSTTTGTTPDLSDLDMEEEIDIDEEEYDEDED